jgi:hypothetical protein
VLTILRFAPLRRNVGVDALDAYSTSISRSMSPCVTCTLGLVFLVGVGLGSEAVSSVIERSVLATVDSKKDSLAARSKEKSLLERRDEPVRDFEFETNGSGVLRSQDAIRSPCGTGGVV